MVLKVYRSQKRAYGPWS